VLGTGKNPVANLEILNKLFFSWVIQKEVSRKGSVSVLLKHYKLVNQSILGCIVEAKNDLDLRL